MEEERFTRLKHQAGFPSLAVQHSLAYAGLDGARSRSRRDLARSERASSPQADVRAVAGPEPRPRCAIGCRTCRSCATSRRRSPKRSASTNRRCGRRSTASSIIARTWRAASSSRRSSAPRCCRSTASATSSARCGARGCGNKIEVDGWVEFPHSMGLLYTAITQYLGFPKYGDEFKVMGLAPYGEPEYLDRAPQARARQAGRRRSSSISRTSCTTAKAST